MTYRITLDQQLDELRAELSWNDDPKERRQIMNEIWVCELMQVALDWKAATDAERPG